MAVWTYLITASANLKCHHSCYNTILVALSHVSPTTLFSWRYLMSVPQHYSRGAISCQSHTTHTFPTSPRDNSEVPSTEHLVRIPDITSHLNDTSEWLIRDRPDCGLRTNTGYPYSPWFSSVSPRKYSHFAFEQTALITPWPLPSGHYIIIPSQLCHDHFLPDMPWLLHIRDGRSQLCHDHSLACHDHSLPRKSTPSSCHDGSTTRYHKTYTSGKKRLINQQKKLKKAPKTFKYASRLIFSESFVD
jgi:hypothetical protein